MKTERIYSSCFACGDFLIVELADVDRRHPHLFNEDGKQGSLPTCDDCQPLLKRILEEKLRFDVGTFKGSVARWLVELGDLPDESSVNTEALFISIYRTVLILMPPSGPTLRLVK